MVVIVANWEITLLEEKKKENKRKNRTCVKLEVGGIVEERTF